MIEANEFIGVKQELMHRTGCGARRKELMKCFQCEWILRSYHTTQHTPQHTQHNNKT